MNQEFLTRSLRYALLITLFAMLGACASTTSTAVENEAPQEKVYDIEPWEGDPMLMPLDGSSRDAWDYSLARFEAHATPAQMNGLTNSIRYLQTYDVGARGDYDKLVTRLDGKTPQQIMDNVMRHRTPYKAPEPEATAPAEADSSGG